MWHRIREAIKRGGLSSVPPMGGKGKARSPGPRFGPHHKRAILSLVERGGEVRSFYVENAPVEKVAKIVRENVDEECRLHTDESKLYRNVGKEFAAHEAVNHSKKEYVRGDVTTNNIEQAR